ncbi:MAG: TRAP transporter small permease [Alphaproteobacteria bacterium]|nr:TRAP transporter small permease [Alphaproteobacteria bacterium]MCY4319465.1 TRAP transporter small permease [Alphaproteobacteria bacterium]
MNGNPTETTEPAGFELLLDRTYRALHVLLNKVVARIAAVILLCGTLLACIEIVRRYILGVVFDWGQDAVTYVSISAVFIYFAVTQASRSHLAVLALLDLLRSRGYVRTVLTIRVLVSGVSLTLFTALAYWGIPAVERAEKLGRTTQSMVIYIWPFQACLVIGFGLMALVTLFHLYQDVQALRGRTVFPWAPAEEGIEI